MSDTSEDIAKTKNTVKPKNKKGFREPTSLHVDPRLWQEVRIMAMLKNVSVTEYFEGALRKKIDEDNREAGRKGYQVGQGGMYIPPPPAPAEVPQPQQTQTQQQQEQKFNVFENDIAKLPEDDYYSRYQLIIPEIEYPISKKGLIQHVKNFQNEFIKKYKKVPLRVEHALFLIENLPDSNRTYRNSVGLSDDLEIVMNKKGIVEKLFGKTTKLIGCAIIHLPSDQIGGTMEALIKTDHDFRRNYEKYFTQDYEKQKQATT